MTKQEIRNIIKDKKSKMTKEEIKTLSLVLTEKFCSLDAYKNASCIYAYMSYNEEVDTSYIIKQAWQDNKKIAVPKTLSSGNTFNKKGEVIPDYMEFIYINSFNELEKGYVGIPEPLFDIEKDEKKIANEKEVLILMPGLAFDKNNNRIGYGGGFYDKYLSSHQTTNFIKIALCFDFQLFDFIPTGPHDEKMDIVLT